MLILYPISQKSPDCMSKNMLKNLECIYYFIINTLTKLGTEGCSKTFLIFTHLNSFLQSLLMEEKKHFILLGSNSNTWGNEFAAIKSKIEMGIQRENVVLFLKAMVKHFEKRLSFRIASSTLQPLSFEKIWTWSDNLSSLNKTTSSLGMWASK